jgi:hypothetical protein
MLRAHRTRISATISEHLSRILSVLLLGVKLLPGILSRVISSYERLCGWCVSSKTSMLVLLLFHIRVLILFVNCINWLSSSVNKEVWLQVLFLSLCGLLSRLWSHRTKVCFWFDHATSIVSICIKLSHTLELLVSCWSQLLVRISFICTVSELATD